MAAKILIILIRIYKTVVSPLLPPSCRFYPSCSDYAGEAVRRFGPVSGSVLAVKRLLRCHPLNPGGYDPVPGCECAGGSAEHQGAVAGKRR